MTTYMKRKLTQALVIMLSVVMTIGMMDLRPFSYAADEAAASDEEQVQEVKEQEAPEEKKKPASAPEEKESGGPEEVEEPEEKAAPESSGGCTTGASSSAGSDESAEKVQAEEAEPDRKEQIQENGDQGEDGLWPEFSQNRTIDGVKVAVSADKGVFPEDAALSVEKVSKKEEKKADAAVDEVRDKEKTIAASYTFDISILDGNGNELQPKEGKAVKVAFKSAEMEEDILTPEVYHIDESGKEAEAQALDVKETKTEAIAETAGFSTYLLLFTYDDLSYELTSEKMGGDGYVTVADVMDDIGLRGEVYKVAIDGATFTGSNKSSSNSMMSIEYTGTYPDPSVVATGNSDVDQPTSGSDWHITPSEGANGTCRIIIQLFNRPAYYVDVVAGTATQAEKKIILRHIDGTELSKNSNGHYSARRSETIEVFVTGTTSSQRANDFRYTYQRTATGSNDRILCFKTINQDGTMSYNFKNGGTDEKLQRRYFAYYEKSGTSNNTSTLSMTISAYNGSGSSAPLVASQSVTIDFVDSNLQKDLNDASRVLGTTVFREEEQKNLTTVLQNAGVMHISTETCDPMRNEAGTNSNYHPVQIQSGSTDAVESVSNEPGSVKAKADAGGTSGLVTFHIDKTPCTWHATNASGKKEGNITVPIYVLKTAIVSHSGSTITLTNMDSHCIYKVVDVTPGDIQHDADISVDENGLATGLTAGHVYKVIEVVDFPGSDVDGISYDVNLNTYTFSYQPLTDENKPVIKRDNTAIGNTSPIVGDDLTAYTDASEVEYAWYHADQLGPDGKPKSGETAIALGASYTVQAGDAGKKLVVVATQTKTDSGSDYGDAAPVVTSDTTSPVEKKDNANAAPSAPTIGTKTDDSITVTAPTGSKYEYGYKIKGSTDDYDWSDAATIEGLKSGIDYEVVVREKETDDTKAGTVSIATDATTTAGIQFTGQAVVGKTLTANDTADGDAKPLTYEWYVVDESSETPISGTSVRSYTLTAAESGKTVKVVVKNKNGNVVGTATSAQVNEHIHSYEYTIGSDSITATCDDVNCIDVDHGEVSTILAAAGGVYTESAYSASLDGFDAFNTATGATAGNITYTGTTAAGTAYSSTSAPNEAGTYTASVTVSYTEKGEAKTATLTKQFAISRADAPTAYPEANMKPSGKTNLIYNGTPQTLVDGPSAKPANYEKILYKVGGGEWSESIPTGKEAGTYVVSYKYVDTDGNYEDYVVSIPVNVQIGKKALTVTAKPKTISYGEAAANDGVSCEGFVSGETASVLVGTLSYTYQKSETETTPYAAGDPVGTYKIVPAGLSSDNYELTFVKGDLTVTKRTVTVSGITASNKTYDGNTGATLVYTGVGFDNLYSGDRLTVTATGAFTDANAGSNKTVNISNIVLGGSSAANYELAATGNQSTTTASIDPKALTGDNKATVTLTLPEGGLTYNGSPQTPQSVVVKDGDTVLTEGTDYEITYTDNTNAGTANAKITFKGNYAGSEQVIKAFDIAKKPIAVKADDLSSPHSKDLVDLTYTVPEASLASGDRKDSIKIDLTTDPARDSEAAAGTNYTITGTVKSDSNPNYQVTVEEGKYTITKAEAIVKVTGFEGPYDGKGHGLTVKVEDQTVDPFTDLLQRVFGTGKEATVYYSTTKPLNAENFRTEGTTTAPTYTEYTNGEKTIYYYVDLTNYTLGEGSDSISGSKTVNIKKAETSESHLDDGQKPTANKDGASDLTYNGNEQDLIKAPTKKIEGYTVKYSVDNGVTWTTEVPKKKDAGTYTVKVQYVGDNNHETFNGDDISVKIEPKEIGLEWSSAEFVYNGDPQQPTATASGLCGSDTCDVTVAVEGEHSNVGNYSAKATAVSNSNYKLPENVIKAYEITKDTADKDDLTPAQKAAGKDDLKYTGSAQALVTAPSAMPTGYTGVLYSTDGATWTEAVPTGIDAGTYTVRVKYVPDGNHGAFEADSINVTIGKKTLTVTWPDNTASAREYNGAEQTIEAVIEGIIDADKNGVKINYADNTGKDVGTHSAKVSISGPGLLGGEDRSGNYEIAAADASHPWSIVKADAQMTAPTAVSDLVYNGKDQALINAGDAKGAGSESTGTIRYHMSDRELTDEQKAALSDDDWTDKAGDIKAENAGTYYVYYYVAGDGNHNDSAVNGPVTVTVAPKSLGSGSNYGDGITAEAADSEYTGSPLTPKVTVKDTRGFFTPARTLEKGTDYTVTIPDGKGTNVEEKIALTVTGKGNYTGSITVPWNITKKAAGDLNDETKPQAAEDLTYNGLSQGLVKNGTGIDPEGGTIQYRVKDKDSNVVSDWSAAKPSAINAGEYTVEYYVKGDENHSDKGSKEQPLGSYKATISPKTLMDADVTFTGTEFTYNKNPQGPAITVKDTVDGSEVTLAVNADYTLTDAVKTDVGTYTAKVTGTGNYTGEITKEYKINKADTAFEALTDDQKPTANKNGEDDLVYNGKAQPLVKAPESALPEGYEKVQYSLDGQNWSDEIPAGTDAKTYNVYYKVAGDANHNDIDCGTIQVVIDQKPVTVKAKDQVISHDGEIAKGIDQVTLGELAEGQSLNGITLTQSTTDEGTIGTITVTGARITDAENNDVTSNYAIAYDNSGKLTIKASQKAPSDEDKNDLIRKQETTSITINTKPGYEYVLSTSPDAPADDADWSALTDEKVKGYYKEKGTENGTYTFEDLDKGTVYYVHMRKAETEPSGDDPGKDPSPSVTVPTSTRPDAPDEAADGYTVDYGEESLTAKSGFELFDPNANNGEGAWVEKVEDFVPGGDYKVRVAGKDGTAPSEPKGFTAPARPDAPDAVGKTDKKDDSITIQNTDKAQEYLVLPAKADGTAYTEAEIEALFKAGKGKDGTGSSITFNKDSNGKDIREGSGYVIYNRYKAAAGTAAGEKPALASNPAGPAKVTTKNASGELTDSEKKAIRDDTWSDETAEPDSITVNGTDGYEYLVVPKRTAPRDIDWSKADKCPADFKNGVKVYTRDSNGGEIKANTDYDILVRKSETDEDMPSEPETVEAYTTRPQPEDGEGHKEDYIKELIEVEDGYEIRAISPAGTEPSEWTEGTKGENGKNYVPLTPGATYEIRKKADSPNKGDHESEPAVFTTADHPTAPTTPEQDKLVGTAGNDGSIKGVDDTMEYSTDGGKTWKPVPDNAVEITGLGEGEVLVRYEEVKDAEGKTAQPASEPAKVDVKKKDSNAAPVDAKDIHGKTETNEILITSPKNEEGKTPVYEYSIDGGKTWTTDSDFRKDGEGNDLKPGTTYEVQVRKAETEDSMPSEPAAVHISTKPEKIEEPDKDAGSITIKDPDPSLEYIVVPKGTDPESLTEDDWKNSRTPEEGKDLTIGGLEPGTEYEVITRKPAEKDDEGKVVTPASEPSEPTPVATQDNAPVEKDETATKITIKPEEGSEYIVVPKGQKPTEDDWKNAKAGDAGSDELTFTGLEPETPYDVYSRKEGIPATQSDPTEVTTDPSGEYKSSVEIGEGVPQTKVEGVDESLAKAVCSSNQKEEVHDGQDATITLEITDIDDAVSDEDKKISDETAKAENKKSVAGKYIDISLYLKVGSGEKQKLHDTNGRTVSFRISVPESMKNSDKKVARTYYLIRIHDGKGEVIARTTGDVLEGETTVFSTYVIAYADKAISQDELDRYFNEKFKVSQPGAKITVEWGKVPGAELYEVYATYCGTYSYEMVKRVKGNKIHKITFRKLKGRKIDRKRNFKLYVRAFRIENGKKIQITKTMTGHIVGNRNFRFTNPKGIRLTRKTMTLKVGQKAKIKAKVLKVSKKKNFLPRDHAPMFRYTTSNKKVAAVDRSGRITAKKAGTCYVYVYAKNGYGKKMKVTVK